VKPRSTPDALVLVALVFCAFATGLAGQIDSRPTTGSVIQVPFDHEHPADGTFPLYYELGQPFDARKPTVFVIADGQQFYVRAGSMAALQDEIFGDNFNLVGIVGRGANAAVLSRIGGRKSVDWAAAWQLLKSDQWVEDIERVRLAIVGRDGKISLYGRSGGGLLVHQYLSRYHASVRTAFTQAAVNRFVDASLGISSDTFWTDIGDIAPALRTQLLDTLKQHPSERARIVVLLQRQNFFVGSDAIRREREALIHALHEWDEERLAKYALQYQVDQVLAMLEASNPPVQVRLFELFAPVLASRSEDGSRVDPDIEVGRLFSEPLMQRLKAGRLPAPSMDLAALHQAATDVYLLAGRFDHTADYRSQIALASHYPRHRLLLVADNHDFPALQKTGLYSQLVQTALRDGIDGPRTAGVERLLGSILYRE